MSASQGYIYLLTNIAMEGLIKIGATIKHPIERTRELSAATGVAVPFTLVYHRAVADPFKVEAALHRMLDQYRVNDSREFFKIELHEVIVLLEQYDECRAEWIAVEDELPWSLLFNSFPDDEKGRRLTPNEKYQCDVLEAKLKR